MDHRLPPFLGKLEAIHNFHWDRNLLHTFTIATITRLHVFREFTHRSRKESPLLDGTQCGRNEFLNMNILFIAAVWFGISMLNRCDYPFSINCQFHTYRNRRQPQAQHVGGIDRHGWRTHCISHHENLVFSDFILGCTQRYDQFAYHIRRMLLNMGTSCHGNNERQSRQYPQGCTSKARNPLEGCFAGIFIARQPRFQ